MNNMSKKLTKSINSRMICGVCGGIGEYFHIDPTMIRLIWVILTFGSIGSGLIVYIIAAVIIPEE
jgi:Putative stress-responsive transcriptional regulator